LAGQRQCDLDLHGRGLTVVGGLSRAFGVLPTEDGGKLVWALLEAPCPPSAGNGKGKGHRRAHENGTMTDGASGS
jgi:hypothetical protein